MSRPALLTCALLIAQLAWAAQAQAQVRRCVDAQGNSVFTDGSCSALDAKPRAAPVPHSGAYAKGFARRGCARSPQALLEGVRDALELQDANRLATYYHWSGTGSGAAKYLMDQLEGIAARPLVAVELVYPDPGLAVAESAVTAPDPLSLRVDQMRGSGDPTVARLEFGLRQNAGCWWIEL